MASHAPTTALKPAVAVAPVTAAPGRRRVFSAVPPRGASRSYSQAYKLQLNRSCSLRLRRPPHLLPHAVLKPTVEGDSPDNELQQMRADMEALLPEQMGEKMNREEILKVVSEGEYASLRGDFDREKLINFFARYESKHKERLQGHVLYLCWSCRRVFLF